MVWNVVYSFGVGRHEHMQSNKHNFSKQVERIDDQCSADNHGRKTKPIRKEKDLDTEVVVYLIYWNESEWLMVSNRVWTTRNDRMQYTSTTCTRTPCAELIVEYTHARAHSTFSIQRQSSFVCASSASVACWSVSFRRMRKWKKKVKEKKNSKIVRRRARQQFLILHSRNAKWRNNQKSWYKVLY